MRGERLALARVEVGTADVSPGAPQDEFLQVYGIDEEGRIALQVWFDVEDVDAAIAELDAAHALADCRSHLNRQRRARQRVRRVGPSLTAATDREAWDEFEELYAPDVFVESRRQDNVASPQTCIVDRATG